jgi:phage/plasmid primase-like uncharacterized protein
MSAPSLAAIALYLGGEVRGDEVLAPTPGHSPRDRGTTVRLMTDAPDGVWAHVFNGGVAEALAVKDRLREVGLLPAFNDKRRELTAVEREKIKLAELNAAGVTTRRHERAAEIARQRLAQSRPADAGHPYLRAKRIGPEGLRQAGAWLMAPMVDVHGEIWNVQFIAGDGTKRFSKGARVKGLFWWVGDAVDRLAVAEGVASGAGFRRATGWPIAAAMSTHNLPIVAAAIHAQRPDLELWIACDDDPTGREAACKASLHTGAKIVLPGGHRAR